MELVILLGEAYVYSNASDHNSGSENHYIFDTASGNTGSLQYYQGVFNYYNSTVGGNGQNAGGFDRDRWVHLAVARESGTTRMFIDGVLKTLLQIVMIMEARQR